AGTMPSSLQPIVRCTTFDAVRPWRTRCTRFTVAISSSGGPSSWLPTIGSRARGGRQASPAGPEGRTLREEEQPDRRGPGHVGTTKAQVADLGLRSRGGGGGI